MRDPAAETVRATPRAAVRRHNLRENATSFRHRNHASTQRRGAIGVSWFRKGDIFSVAAGQRSGDTELRAQKRPSETNMEKGNTNSPLTRGAERQKARRICPVPQERTQDGSERRESQERTMMWYYGDTLRERRRELKITQQELAGRVGVRTGKISRIEKGEEDLSFSLFIRILGALGMQMDLQFRKETRQ